MAERRSVTLSLSVVVITTSIALIRSSPAAAQRTRPNILLLVSDDQTWSTFPRALMPTVYPQLVDKGTLFDRAYMQTSLCCPSRSEILTGLDERHTGVDDNVVGLNRPVETGVRSVGQRREDPVGNPANEP